MRPASIALVLGMMACGGETLGTNAEAIGDDTHGSFWVDIDGFGSADVVQVTVSTDGHQIPIQAFANVPGDHSVDAITIRGKLAEVAQALEQNQGFRGNVTIHLPVHDTTETYSYSDTALVEVLRGGPGNVSLRFAGGTFACPNCQ